ncbi:MAG: rRNA maturation RNase YbeY [Pseudomonadota bacterium]
MSINIDIADERWSGIFSVQACVERWVAAVRVVLQKEQAAMPVAVRLSNDEEVRELNRTFRHKDAPTNVLSFPSAPGDELAHFEDEAGLGDIILALETVQREAEMDGKNFESHVAHLVVHGVLHLAGYDHEEQSAAEEMENLEIRILQSLGIADPYA